MLSDKEQEHQFKVGLLCNKFVLAGKTGRRSYLVPIAALFHNCRKRSAGNEGVSVTAEAILDFCPRHCPAYD